VSRILKKLKRILNNPIDVKWNEILPILRYFSFVCEPPKKGSHWVVYHPNNNTNLTIPVHNNRVKKVCVKEILKLIQEIKEEEESERPD
jgi:predicted RNA binding protein YcfA (HicA-like mRNA interferase family)